MTDEIGKVPIDSVRNTLYQRYESELTSLWSHSRFIWGFVTVLFTAYGFVASKLFLGAEKLPYGNAADRIALIIAVIGLCITAIWIALAKASKAWQEHFETLIADLERDKEIFPHRWHFALGGFHSRLPGYDDRLSTFGIASYSPSRINILIPQCIWVLWILIFVFHSFRLILSGYAFYVPVAIGAYLVFVRVLKSKLPNEYRSREKYGKEFVFDAYIELLEAEKRFVKLRPCDSEVLKDFLLDDFARLYHRVSMAVTKGNTENQEREWEQGNYWNLLKDFKGDCMRGNPDVDKYLDRIGSVIEEYKDKLRGRYGV